MDAGAPIVHVPHATAAVLVNLSADPELRRDFLDFLARLIPQNRGFRHAEGNADSHPKSVFTGHAATLIVDGGSLAPETWQSIWFAEYDGPRNREVRVQLAGGGGLESGDPGGGG
ncbi:MAG: YjbQ family protein, partial [Candidatus Sericytochromatia bacterium]|nr:YjbQ family protein [Candidatus Tanganyikabacteria bacterium]